MRKSLLISGSRDSAVKREVRLVLRDVPYSVMNGTRRSGAGGRDGGLVADWRRNDGGLAAECEREETAADDKLRNRHNGALAAAEKF